MHTRPPFLPVPSLASSRCVTYTTTIPSSPPPISFLHSQTTTPTPNEPHRPQNQTPQNSATKQGHVPATYHIHTTPKNHTTQKQREARRPRRVGHLRSTCSRGRGREPPLPHPRQPLPGTFSFLVSRSGGLPCAIHRLPCPVMIHTRMAQRLITHKQPNQPSTDCGPVPRGGAGLPRGRLAGLHLRPPPPQRVGGLRVCCLLLPSCGRLRTTYLTPFPPFSSFPSSHHLNTHASTTTAAAT